MNQPVKSKKIMIKSALVLLIASLTVNGVLFIQLNRSNARFAQAAEQLQVVTQERDLLDLQGGFESQPSVLKRADLFQQLQQNPQLIPISADLGGTMRYYEETFALLGQQNAYVYAEDGHNAVEMWLKYQIESDQTVTWTLFAYNAGNGWRSDGKKD